MQEKRDFLVNTAYWAVIALAVYLGFEYLLPISVPFIFGLLIAWLVVWLSGKLRCTNRFFRLGLTILAYGIIGLVITLLSVKSVSTLSGIIRWLPEFYELKILPLVTLVYNWATQAIAMLDPALLSALEMLLEGVLSGLKNLITHLSGVTVDLISGLATGIPNLILSLLAMIFSTVFVVIDYERIAAFYVANTPKR